MNNIIENWRIASDEVAKAFMEKYFPERDFDNEYSCHWIGGKKGSIFTVCDMYFNVDRMIEALELDATIEQLAEYADGEIEHMVKQVAMPVTFETYVTQGKEKIIKK